MHMHRMLQKRDVQKLHSHIESYGKRNTYLRKHLQLSNPKYTSKTIQNQLIHIYANKVRERLCKALRENNLPFAIFDDEFTDPHANRENFSLCAYDYRRDCTTKP